MQDGRYFIFEDRLAVARNPDGEVAAEKRRGEAALLPPPACARRETEHGGDENTAFRARTQSPASLSVLHTAGEADSEVDTEAVPAGECLRCR